MRRSRIRGWMWGISLFLMACTDSSRYVQALPEDAALISSVDLKSMALKIGWNEEKEKNITQKLQTVLGSGLEGSQALINKIVHDPSECGLALTDKIYFFAGAQSAAVGMLARIANRNKLEDLLNLLCDQQLCEALRQSDGCTWTTVGNVLVAYSDVALLAMVRPRGGNPEDLQHQAAMLLRQDEGEGFTATSDYKKMSAAEGDIVTFFSLNLLPREYVTPLTMGVSAELNLQDVKALSVLDFKNGKATMDIENLTTNELMNSLVDKSMKACLPVKGIYLDAFPSNAGLWATAHIDGAKVYELLNENPVISRQFKKSMIPLDFQAIFGAIKGDIAVAMPDPLHSRAFIAYADVENRTFLQTFEDLKPMLSLSGGQMQLVDQGKDAYLFYAADASAFNMRKGPIAFWFGVKDGRFYVTNYEKLIGEKVLGWSLRDTKWGNEVEGKRFFAAVNLVSVMNGLDYFIVDLPDGKKARLELVMKDDRVNILQQWLRIIGL